jgi:hypothetical protein
MVGAAVRAESACGVSRLGAGKGIPGLVSWQGGRAGEWALDRHPQSPGPCCRGSVQSHGGWEVKQEEGNAKM